MRMLLKLILILLPLTASAKFELFLNPYFIGIYENESHCRIETGFKYTGNAIQFGTDYKYQLIKTDTKYENLEYAGFAKYLYRSVYANTYYRHDSYRNERIGGLDAGYVFKTWFNAATGYALSKREYYRSLMALKLNFPIHKLFKYRLHMRSNFNDRPFEWWQEFSSEANITKRTSLVCKYQIDHEDNFTQTEINILLNFIIGGQNE